MTLIQDTIANEEITKKIILENVDLLFDDGKFYLSIMVDKMSVYWVDDLTKPKFPKLGITIKLDKDYAKMFQL